MNVTNTTETQRNDERTANRLVSELIDDLRSQPHNQDKWGEFFRETAGELAARWRPIAERVLRETR